jgi:nudix-type nucleoside diphosphatase (YffH/AdpP family)
MNSLFFYGTLRHVPLLSAVLGRDAGDLDFVTAQLPGHDLCAVAGEVFPMIVPGAQGAPGLLVRGLNDEDVARLRFYEGGYDYDLELVEVLAGDVYEAARVFFPEPGVWQPDGPWSLSDWAVAYGEWSVFGAEEEMSYFGVRSREEVDQMLPMIQARARATVTATLDNRAVSPGGMTLKDVALVSLERPYAQYFALEEYDLKFRRYDGARSSMVRRAVFVATDAAIVLPYDPVRDRVLLIEQFRPGPFARGDDKPWMLEPIAGRVDGGETPETTAHREAAEEAGLSLKTLHKAGQCYASPGCSSEYFHIFVAIADLPDMCTGVGGISDEAEDIRSFLYSYDALMGMVDSMQIANAPLALAALWLARHRDRLRGAA